MDGRYNSRRNAGRPEAETIELTIVCFDKVSPDGIPKCNSSSWSDLEEKNLIKQIKISKIDYLSEKIRKEFNLDQGWKLYNAGKERGRLIEVTEEINFESVKSNMTRNNRRLYIGPDTHDIVINSDVRDQPSRSHVNKLPVASTSTTENVINRSHTNGLPVAGTSTTENVINRSHTSGLPVAGTSTTENVINRCHTNELPVDNCDPNSLGSHAELNDIGLSESSYNNSINGGSINRNINGNYADTSANGNVNNQSSHGHTNELSDCLTLEGVKYSLVQVILSPSHISNLPAYADTLVIGSISYLILPTNDSLYCDAELSDIGNRDSNYLILRGVKYILVRLNPNHVNNLPTYTSAFMIYGVSYLVLPETIPTNGGTTNGGVSSNQSRHGSTNEGFQSPASFINNVDSVNVVTYEDINSGYPSLFSNNNTQSYYTHNVQQIADDEDYDDDNIRNFIVYGDRFFPD